MDHNTKNILSDLHAIDPRFEKHEEVSSVISTFIHSKPKAPLDSTFIHRLRQNLIATMSPSLAPDVYSRRTFLSPYRSLFAPSEFRSSVLVAIIAVLIVAPATYVATNKHNQSIDVKNISTTLTQTQQITFKPDNAFGPIALAKTVAAKGVIVNQNLQTDTAGTNALSTMAIVVPTEDAATTSVSEIAYVYAGKPISISSEGSVLKRTTGTKASEALLEMIKGLNFELANLSTFSGLSVRTISLSENKSFGYTLNVDIDSGTINIIQDLKQWPTITPATTTLSADDAIKIATAFLKDHGISTKNYGIPIIANTIPESGEVTLVLPLVVNKRTVYSEDGTAYGMSVTVNNKLNKVIAVNNIMSQLFDSSSYSFETDPLAILASIQATSSADVIPGLIPLDQPELIFVHTFQNLSTSTPSSELYVPALYFRTASSTKNQEVFIVPLVKDLSQSSALQSTTTQA